MKSNVTYSINVKVLQEFNEEVEDQTRSRLIEALMIEFLIKYTRDCCPIPDGDDTLNCEAEAIL